MGFEVDDFLDERFYTEINPRRARLARRGHTQHVATGRARP